MCHCMTLVWSELNQLCKVSTLRDFNFTGFNQIISRYAEIRINVLSGINAMLKLAPTQSDILQGN